MTVTFLGTGSSQGVPVIGCHCPVCMAIDKKNQRLRCSIWVQAGNTSVVIDAGPDFRYQMLRARVEQLDAIIFTHSHKDHIAGLDDVRAYNYHQNKPMDIWATQETQAALRREFAYVFENASYPGIPQVQLHEINNHGFRIGDLEILPVFVKHYKMEVLGFRFGAFTYVTDANYIAPEERDKMRGSNTIVLNALRNEPHISHFTLPEAIDVAQDIAAPNTYFTHISHQLGLHETVNKTLPSGMCLAYDGLTLHFPD